MKIWIVNLKSKSSDTTDEMKKSYINTGTCGMGWRPCKNISSQQDYIDQAKVKWPNEFNKFNYACNNYHNMKKDDIVLTRISTSYYIGRIADDSPFYGEDGYSPYNISSWMRKVDWYLIGNQDETPAPIVAQLSARFQKTIDIRHDRENGLYKYCEVVFSHLTHQKCKISKIKLTVDNFANNFDDQDLEDIVGLYLQKEKNCLFYPSSCKQATKSHEYILKSPTNKIVYAQVKHNASIDVSHYTTDEYKDSIVYLFSNKDYNNKQEQENVIIISKEELYNFTIKNIDAFQRRMKYTKMLFEI